MKVKFKQMLNGYTGVVDDSVIYFVKRLNRCVIRRRPRRHFNEQQVAVKSIMRNIFFLQPSQGYKEDLAEYLQDYQQLRHNRQEASQSWNNLYMKLMFAMERTLPGVDLSTLTRQEIYDRALPCLSVKAAVEAGLLPVVKNYERFDHQM